MPRKIIVTERRCSNCGEELIVTADEDGTFPTNEFGRFIGMCLSEECPDKNVRVAISPEHMPKEA